MIHIKFAIFICRSKSVLVINVFKCRKTFLCVSEIEQENWAEFIIIESSYDTFSDESVLKKNYRLIQLYVDQQQQDAKPINNNTEECIASID